MTNFKLQIAMTIRFFSVLSVSSVVNTINCRTCHYG